eukprot:CAMPEP_0179335054 /NCGR_PEP_ID=MMETSP0797-20121207/66280_1 /TAXON_ID=47934 /ORGANISM="Dinophysis acuminata, Strain DAEP01" /LENGTH=159 /DNA_ID=CAMNT_0021048399 /DNA_START=115 /DNA_END=592 /DNA_ORIENTATION=+
MLGLRGVEVVVALPARTGGERHVAVERVPALRHALALPELRGAVLALRAGRADAHGQVHAALPLPAKPRQAHLAAGAAARQADVAAPAVPPQVLVRVADRDGPREAGVVVAAGDLRVAGVLDLAEGTLGRWGSGARSLLHAFMLASGTMVWLEVTLPVI